MTELTAVTGTPSLLRSLNDRTTLGLLLDRGVLSRSELSAASGLSKPTAAQSLQRLHELGLVAVVGSRPGRPGPAAQLFEVDPSAGYAIGIDVADRRVRIRVRDANGTALAESTADPGGRDVVRVLAGLYTSATRDVTMVPEAARCVVVGVSGSYDAAADTVRHAGHLAPTTSGLDRPRLAERIGDALQADVTIENDVKLVAVAEHHIGAATDVRTSVLLWAQGGVGAAAVIDGRVHRGVTGSAGELGYLPVPGVPLTSGDNPQGGFQQWAGGDAVTEVGLRHGFCGPAEQMIRAAVAEPGIGGAFLSELADRYATGIAALVAILDPELVVLSGSFFTAGGGELTRRVAQSVARQAMRPVPVVLGALGDHPVLTGATHLAARRLREALLDRIGPAAATLAH